MAKYMDRMVPVDIESGQQTMASEPRNFCLTDMAGKSRYREYQELNPCVAAVTKMRMRALCNELKSGLLGDDADPFMPQSDLVAGLDGIPTADERTWLAWWLGQPMQPSKLRSLPRHHQRWMEDSEMGSPVQRHFAALYVWADGLLPLDEDWGRQQRDVDRLVRACGQVWIRLTSTAPMSASANVSLNLATQLSEGHCMPEPSLRFATPKDAMHVACGSLNPHAFEVPLSVRRLHAQTDRFSLIGFLVGFAAGQRVYGAWWEHPWVFDLATLVSMACADVNTAFDRVPSEHLGGWWEVALLLNYTLWGPWEMTERALNSPVPEVLSSVVIQRDWTIFLQDFRMSYYAALEGIGISADQIAAAVRGCVDVN